MKINQKSLSDDDWRSKRLEAMQLFTPAAPIDEKDLFAGRNDQVERMLECVVERGKHAVLFGERGVGKTSLAKVFSAMFPASLKQICLIREQVDPSDDFSSIWRKVFKDIYIKNGHDVSQVSQMYPDEIAPDDVRRVFEEIFGPNAVPIIVIDEFDKSRDSNDKKIHEYMANTIKYLSDYAVNATIILVGVADDINDLIGEHPSISRCIEQILMPRMQREEIREILDKRTQMLGMNFHPDAYFKIVELSNGLPTYAHLLGLYSIQNAIERKNLTITENDVNRAISRSIEKSQESTQHDYSNATHSNREDSLYRQVLLACALAKTDERGQFSPIAVVEPLSEILKRPMTIANFQQHLQKFITEERGSILIRKGKNRSFKFRFRDPMMQPFIIMKGIQDELIPPSFFDRLSFPEEPMLPINFEDNISS